MMGTNAASDGFHLFGDITFANAYSYAVVYSYTYILNDVKSHARPGPDQSLSQRLIFAVPLLTRHIYHQFPQPQRGEQGLVG